MGTKTSSICEVAGLESSLKMWRDVIRQWMKLIQKKNHQTRLSNKALNTAIPVFSSIINIQFLSDFFLKSK